MTRGYMDLSNLTITKVKEGLKKKSFSSNEIANAYLERIKSVEPKLNAFVTVTEDEARADAKAADEKLSRGEDLPLLGIPISVKDNYCTLGVRTTASSKVLDDFISPYNATVYKKLKDAGVVLLGKTNMDAWAHGSSTETSDYGTTKNPWNINHLPGGSSGGAAASVAADEAVIGMGSETAGSIRQPASWCGVVGLKPTYGRVSRYGVVAMGSSLDCPGPITNSVEDAALVLNVIAGNDELDATTFPNPVEDYTADLKKSIQGLTIGISDVYFNGVADEVKNAIMEAIKEFEKLGAKVKKLDLFDPKYAIAVYTIIQRAEVSSNLARYDGIRYGFGRDKFGKEAKRRIMLGTYALSSGYYDQYYNKASKVRTVIIDDFHKAFKEVDVIVAPTSPTPAVEVGASEKSAMFGELADVLVEPSSVAGIPGINVPCGITKAGLPVGMQIMGPFFGEKLLCNVAYQFEQATEWHTKRPEIARSA